MAINTNTTYSLTQNGNIVTFSDSKGNSNSFSLPTSTKVSTTITSAGWSSNSPYTLTITVNGVTISNNITINPGTGITSTQYNAICDAKIICSALTTNSITLTCYGTKPTVDIPINVIILG